MTAITATVTVVEETTGEPFVRFTSRPSVPELQIYPAGIGGPSLYLDVTSWRELSRVVEGVIAERERAGAGGAA